MIEMMGSIHAPDLLGGSGWLNTDKPISLSDLKGKFVLLDFWTYCCINCIHVIPELRKLEDQFPDTLVVIGVHAAKYYAEQDLRNIRQAVLRYDIKHPVVNDKNHRIWNNYAVSAWPTTAFISPDGMLLGNHAGEFEADSYAQVISRLEKEYEEKGKLVRSRMEYPLECDKEPARTLDFPGKVLADIEQNRLFISDSSHHRIIMTDLNGSVQAVIGNGTPGMNDGSFDDATFRSPQGLACDGTHLYVADTDNHAIRMVDLQGRRVKRIAGTGEQSRVSRRSGEALSTLLSSPWDLALGDNILYIAMAGNHQIWTLDIRSGEMHRLIGTGREALADGSLERCALAQTSGLSLSGDILYFADSETSSIRAADLTNDRVTTIVGEGLFEFGDIDGQGPDVRLQHCLGVTHHSNKLYVADSYNNKIKIVDPEHMTSHSYLGSGKSELQDGNMGKSAFWEPGGLSVSGGILYIADTNNHAVRIADLSVGDVTTLEIKGL